MHLPQMFSLRSRQKTPTDAKAALSPTGGATPVPGLIHVIATRHGIGVFDEQWFDYRQLLLEHLTMASLDAQTERDFTWLIGIDREMPERARERLDSLVRDRPYVRLLEMELKADFKGAVAAWTRKEAARVGAAWTLTTRLDDDDALHRSLVARLQAEAGTFLRKQQPRSAVITPVLGCDWVPVEMAGHRAFHPSPSMGLTALLPADGRHTVYSWNHMKLAEQLAPSNAGIRCIEDDTMWWLYTHTGISDQHHEGSNRRTKAFAHSQAFEFDSSFLEQFGITAPGAAAIRATPEPEPVDTTHYLTDRGREVEREIVQLRRAISKSKDQDEKERARERIAELHRARQGMHRHLVQPGGAGTADA